VDAALTFGGGALGAAGKAVAPMLGRGASIAMKRVGMFATRVSGSKASQLGEVGVERDAYKFKLGEDVARFEKHGARLANKLDLGSEYSIEQYVQDANHVIQEGLYVPELHAYVKIPTGKGSAQAPFVGLDRATNEITTFHMKPVSFLEKNAPSLGWQAKPTLEINDLVGHNRELGWKSPYRMGL